MNTFNNQHVPPDGGWGWMVIFALSINNMLTVPMIQVFGFIFGEKLERIGLKAREKLLITNTNMAFGLLLGIFNGVLLKKLGYRKVAYLAAAFTTIGLFITAFANSFTSFMIAYGLLYSTGTGMGKATFNLAVNTFFLEKRSKAVAIAFTVSAVGAIFYPQIASFLLNHFTVEQTVIILTGITGNLFVAASLLQPVKWHMKLAKNNEINTENEIIKSDENENEENKNDDFFSNQSRKLSLYSLDELVYDDYIQRSTLSLRTESEAVKRKFSSKTYSSVASLDEKHLLTCSKVIDNQKEEILNNNNIKSDHNLNENGERKKETTTSFLKSASKLFELTLLVDPIFLNIILGIAFASFADLNFSMLTALILTDFGLEKDQIATFMSVMSIAELIFRFLSPYVEQCLKQSPRVLYMISLTLQIFSRFLFIYVNGYKLLLLSGVFMGIFRGLRTVYMNLIIPSYVPLNKLAGASGIQYVSFGILFLIGGPFLGMVKDITRSYVGCVLIINFLTALTVVMWSVEMIFSKIKQSSN